MSTGGEAFQTNDLAVIFKRAVTQASAFYLIGYSKDVPMDGKFHEIKVRVKRRGLEVRSRAGYWAPRAADVEHAKAKEVEVPPAVADALARLLAVDAPRAVDLWAGTRPLATGRTQVTVAWLPRTISPGAEPVSVQVSVTATSDKRPVFEGPIANEGTSFEAPPGPLQLAFAIRDARGDAIDREVRVLPVPDAASPDLRVSTPTVYRARTLKEAREGHQPVYAGRDFERTDRVILRFATSGSASANASVSARLLGRAGAPLTSLPVQSDPQGDGYVIELPLTSIARGEFVVSIEASRGDERAEALMAFRILR
jgi:hypothetical protein